MSSNQEQDHSADSTNLIRPVRHSGQKCRQNTTEEYSVKRTRSADTHQGCANLIQMTPVHEIGSN